MFISVFKQVSPELSYNSNVGNPNLYAALMIRGKIIGGSHMREITLRSDMRNK
jgi:hypothetical protein